MYQTIRLQYKQQGIAAMVFMVIIACMIFGGLYFYKQSQNKFELLNQYISKIEADLGNKSQTVREFKKQLAKVSDESITQDAIIGYHLRTLNEDFERIGARMSKVEAAFSQSWLLSEVEYLLKMSDYRILMKEDVKGAIYLLKSADNLIKKISMEEQGLLDVRVAISKDVSSLEIYRSIDVPGTYVKLVALGESIEKLPLIPREIAIAGGEGGTIDSQEKTTFEKINETFGDYLTIRSYSSEELKKLLSVDEERHLRDSLRLTFEQAQTALLRGEQSIYDASLIKVRSWLNDHFVGDNFQVEQAIGTLEKLTNIQLEKDLPSISASQQELKRYLSDRMPLGEL